VDSVSVGSARSGDSVALGVLLVIVGMLFLLDSFDVIEGVGFGELWPVILIAVGVAIIYERVRRSIRRR
jgi:hypothetical protein